MWTDHTFVHTGWAKNETTRLLEATTSNCPHLQNKLARLLLHFKPVFVFYAFVHSNLIKFLTQNGAIWRKSATLCVPRLLRNFSIRYWTESICAGCWITNSSSVSKDCIKTVGLNEINEVTRHIPSNTALKSLQNGAIVLTI